jgi:hypothetical protein
MININSLKINRTATVNITWPVTKIVSQKNFKTNRTLILNISNPPIKGDLTNYVINMT